MASSSSYVSTHSLDIASLNKVCDSADRIIVYGLESCDYGTVFGLINKVKGKAANCFFNAETFVLKGLDHNVTLPAKANGILVHYKHTLNNIVFANWVRTKQGLPLLPILFCIEKEERNIGVQVHKKLNIEKVVSKTICKGFTDSEIRRAYKLCCLFPHEEIRTVARKTFCFARVEVDSTNHFSKQYSLTGKCAPWEEKGAPAFDSVRKYKLKFADTLVASVKAYEDKNKLA